MSDNSDGDDITKKITSLATVIGALVTVLNKTPIFKLIFIGAFAFVTVVMVFYKTEVLELFKEKKSYVKIADIGCVSDFLYDVSNKSYVLGVEMFVFQPKGQNKEYCERIFSKTDSKIKTPKKINIIDMYEVYINLLEYSTYHTNGGGKTMIDFYLNESTEKDIAYFFSVKANDGGIFAMLIVYSKELNNNQIKTLSSVAKYSISHCNQ